VRLSPGEARIVPLEGATPLIVRWEADATASVTERDLDDPVLSSVWGSQLHRVEIDVTGRDHLELTVEMDPPIRGDEE
jgi:hypothetical protein